MPRRYRRKRRSVKKLVKSALAAAIETKTGAFEYNEVAISNGGHSSNISDLVQGTGQSDRIGNEYRLRSFHFRGGVFAADDTNLFRVILYSPKASTATIGTPQVFDALDLDRFRIYHDRLYPISKLGGPGCKLIRVSKSWSRGKSTGLKVTYSGPLASDAVKNRIFMYFVSDSSLAAHPTVTGHYRIKFKDA